jgi:hypothetical protein
MADACILFGEFPEPLEIYYNRKSWGRNAFIDSRKAASVNKKCEAGN